MENIKIKVEVENVEALESLKQLEYQFISAAEAGTRLRKVLDNLENRKRKWYQFWRPKYTKFDLSEIITKAVTK